MKWGGNNGFRVVAGIVGTAILVSLCAPPARGEPVDGGPVAEAQLLSLADLGSDTIIPFYGEQGVASLTLPVPSGLVPASLDAIVEIPVNLVSGTLTVMQDDRSLSRVPLPTTDRVPISIPLAGAVITDNALTLTLRSYLEPAGDFCFDPTNPLRLVQANVRYTGAELAPATVADFLPPVLQQLNLFLPAEPTPAETDAAIRMATAVVDRYGRQNTVVTVTALEEGQPEPAGPTAPLQRRMVIREEAEMSVRLTDEPGVPTLLVTGPAAELANQSRLMSSDMSKLALASKAVAGPLSASPELPADTTSLRDLGQPGLTATALSPQVNIALDQTRFGRPVQHIRVHLQGSYTPLPSSVGGQLVAVVGGETIDRWPVDGTGTIDHWVDVPDALLLRYTSLGVALTVTGDTGQCGNYQPAMLTIDGDSAVETARADRPTPAGFQSLPQALMPRVEIGISNGFDDARRAVGILTGLQRMSTVPIETAVVSVDEALASSNPALLIEATSWNHDEVTLPVAGNADGELTVQNAEGSGEAGTLQLDPALAFGSLQTVFDGTRSLLIATSNGAPAQLDGLLDWLDSDTRRWIGLTGDALISAPSEPGAPPSPPVMVDTADETAAAGEPAVEEQRFPTQAVGIGAAVVVVAALVAAAVLLVRRRKT